jgi:hypothetical protein
MPVVLCHIRPLIYMQVGNMLLSPLEALERNTKARGILHTGMFARVWIIASSEGANTRFCDALADLYFVATSSGRDAGKSLNILEVSAIVSAITLTWLIVATVMGEEG